MSEALTYLNFIIFVLMRNITIILFFLLSYTSLYSQTVFNKLILDTIKVISTDMAKLNNNYYIVTSYRDGSRGTRIKKVDLNGNIIGEVIKHNSTKNIYEAAKTCLVVNNDNQIVLLTTEFSYLTDSQYVSLTCYDTTFNLLWEKSYLKDTISIAGYDIIQTKDKGYAVCGSVFTVNQSYNSFLLKIDSLGNQKWIKTYGSNNQDDIFNVIETNDGYMLAGRNRQYNQYKDDWYIVRTDTGGNIIWQWILQNQGLNDFWVKDLIQTQDGSFIAVGGKTYASDNFHTLQNARLLKFDINKNVIIDTLYKEPFFDTNVPEDWNSYAKFDRIKELENGNLLATVRHRPFANKSINFSKLYELSPNGQVLKKRQFHATPYGDPEQLIEDFIVDSTGLTMCGYVTHTTSDNFYPPVSQHIWLIKTDNNYCDGFGSCDTAIHFEFVPVPPADTMYKDSIYTQGIKLTGGLCDTCHYDIRIIVTNANDYYDFILFNPLNVLQDSVVYFDLTYSVYDSINILYGYIYSDSLTGPADFSSLIQTKEKYYYIESNSINDSPTEQQIKIYPNPTTGKIKVEADGIERIELMDLQGRTVLSQNTKDKDQKYDLDLSSQAKGIYFIKVTTAKGVAVEKVIKE